MPSCLSSDAEAFDLLREHIDGRIESVQREIRAQVKEGAYNQAQHYLQRAQALAQLRNDLDKFAERFQDLLHPTAAISDTTRLPRGLKTPQEAYRIPILRTLVDMGGQGNIRRVLKRLRGLMDDELNKYDLATLSDGETPRWRNTAQWARNAMREEGLIRDDTPRGTWAISEKGQRWLDRQTGHSTSGLAKQEQ